MYNSSSVLSANLVSAEFPNMFTFSSTCSSVSAKISFFSGQPENSSLTSFFHPGGIVTSCKLEQPLNTPVPIEVAVTGMGLTVRAVQPLKLLRPMVTQVSGRDSEVKFLQSTNELAAVAMTV